MLYIKLVDGVAVEARAEFPGNPVVFAYEYGKMINRDGWITKNDFKSMAHAEMIADDLNEHTNQEYMAVESNNGWDIIQKPQIGDKVSRGFNGDAYPCGIITKITPSFQITTSTGAKFRRVGNTGKWKETGGSFYMISGVVSKRNLEF